MPRNVPAGVVVVYLPVGSPTVSREARGAWGVHVVMDNNRPPSVQKPGWECESSPLQPLNFCFLVLAVYRRSAPNPDPHGGEVPLRNHRLPEERGAAERATWGAAAAAG